MAKAIAMIGGYALAPGVSKNRRWYTEQHITGAVAAAQERLAKGEEPMVMLTHHGADDDSTLIAGALREVSLAEDGRVRWSAAIPDTPAGRAIATLTDTSDGRPAFLEGVSIRGAWTGKVRKVRAPDGELAEQGEGLELHGLDFTHKPGVPGAKISTFEWSRDGANETSESVLITESVEEARVTTITEPAEAGGAGEAAQTSAPPGTTYADPGYQADKQKRYPLNNQKRIRAAWSYVSQKDNAAQYTGPQLKRVKGRIKAAMRRIGAKVTDEGWVIWPAEQVTEAALAEHYGGDLAGMPADAMAGSFRICASNGPLNVEISSYCVDPADLELILAAAAQSASQAMQCIDPDMDGDMDIPGAGSEDTDRDLGDDSAQVDNGDGVELLVRRLMAAVRGESAEPMEDVLAEARALQAEGEPAAIEAVSTADPAATLEAASQEQEAPMAETTIQEAAPATAAAPALSQADVDAAVQRALDADRTARKAAKAARKAKAAETASAAPVAETATPPASIEQLVADGIKAALQEQGLAETTEQKVTRLVAEGVTAAKQEITAAGGGPSRKGLVAEHSPARPATEGVSPDYPVSADGNVLPMEKWSESNRRAVGQVLQQAFLGSRAEVL